MAYKSNREMRSEYLANAERNRERNRAAYERKQSKKSRNWLVVIVLVVVALYFIKQRNGVSSPVQPIFTPVERHSR